MTDAFYKLPTLILLTLFVGIFSSLQRRDPEGEYRLWFFAWIAVFARVAVQMLVSADPSWQTVASIIDLSGMQISGCLWLISVTEQYASGRRRGALLTTILLPTVSYAVLHGAGVTNIPVYLGIFALAYVTAMVWVLMWKPNRRRPLMFFLVGALTAAAMNALMQISRGRISYGFFCMQCAIYALTGLYFWRRFDRVSAGTVTTVAGFLLWAAAFPSYYFAGVFGWSTSVLTEIVNLPKFFVAIGMVVTMMEEATIRAEAARQSEINVREELQSYSELATRMLGGTPLRQLMHGIAGALRAAHGWDRVIILLADEARHFGVAAQTGLSDKEHARLKDEVAELRAEDVAALCDGSTEAGRGAYLCQEAMTASLQARSGEQYLLVPLRSSRGAVMGAITLFGRAAKKHNDFSPLLMLANDISAALENGELVEQLVRSERLAGIGQLVAGVAHELNNPLTAVIGFTEILAEQVPEDRRAEVEIIRRESVRMKTIIQNLLRFSRQSRTVMPGRHSSSVAAVIDEVLRLRNYGAESQSTVIEQKIAPQLPKASIEDNVLKQVVLNVLNNAYDATENVTPREIVIEAYQARGRVCIRVSDNGPGFADLQRAFDPFYTTKPVGKGTGLGLSICYGIIRDHGGDILVSNRHPHGAVVSLELPVSEQEAAETGAMAATSGA